MRIVAAGRWGDRWCIDRVEEARTARDSAARLPFMGNASQKRLGQKKKWLGEYVSCAVWLKNAVDLLV